MRILDDAGNVSLAVPLNNGEQLAISFDRLATGALTWQRRRTARSAARPPVHLRRLPDCSRRRGQRSTACRCSRRTFARQPAARITGCRVRTRIPVRRRPTFTRSTRNPFCWSPPGADIRRMEVSEIQNVTSWRQVGNEFDLRSAAGGPGADDRRSGAGGRRGGHRLRFRRGRSRQVPRHLEARRPAHGRAVRARRQAASPSSTAAQLVAIALLMQRRRAATALVDRTVHRTHSRTAGAFRR